MTMSSSTPPPTPATSTAGFLQSGFSSSTSSNSSPVIASGNGGSTEAEPVHANHGRSGFNYSPRTVTQVVTFNLARALRRSASRDNPEDN
jgi:hypothetical protein